MIRSLFAISVLSLFSFSAFAGSANADITCTSGSGRTTFKANVPGDYEAALVQVTVDGKTLSYLDEGMVADIELNGRKASEEYPGYLLAAINAAQTKKEISVVVAIDPGTKYDTILVDFKSSGPLTKIPSGGTAYKFKATLEGNDPRAPHVLLPKGIVLNCEYVYEI